MSAVRVLMAAAALVVGLAVAAAAEPPSYAAWQEILADHYEPALGMNYRQLKKVDAGKLFRLRAALSRVDPKELSPDEQLAFWINLYNVNVVAIVIEGYPVASIKDLSTDITGFNVFRTARVPFRGERISLDEIEHQRIRERFRDPRIHFAINCAARSCPPIRNEPFSGAELDRQLDEQTRRFLGSSEGALVEQGNGRLVLRVTRLMDWFEEDFEVWGGGRVGFVSRYLAPESRARIRRAEQVVLEFFDYDWSLNDWSP